MSALALEQLDKLYPGTPAVQDVTFSLGAGETLALLGPSGCGKSTLLRLIAGLERPDSGRVLMAGTDVTALPPERRNLSLVFQDYALFPHLSVLDNAAYGPRQRGIPRAQATAQAREALALVGLQGLEQRRIHALSGGQAQRVALARALAVQPRLLLLDEPLSNLDEQLRARLRGDLRSLFSGLGAAVLLVTHDQREALALASRVALMRAGRLVQLGPTSEVFARPSTAWAAEFLGQPNVFAQGEQALIVPEHAVVLGEGERWPASAQQTDAGGLSVTVSHAVGPLRLRLSAREAALLEGDTLRLRLLDAELLRVPDDR
ncbi:ABC transporter ATP-binding protein [Deinococcus sp. KNUC1210]|uniref:ABC transporter ATP-binding protein n=1 Tax=Deinococcus sp. KNUC1210 TaxID=2917691 RepID=UPI001EF061E0|nr:ABC transporter ATP-binding protein [Deinococcus sp. KNUC1210]ULH15450.1 ABC transporter ATP-binding protein [Deinococcus sp. KNUC1210]